MDPRTLDAKAARFARSATAKLPRTRTLMRLAARTHTIADDLARLSPQQIERKLHTLRHPLRRGRATHDQQLEAIALIKDVARRTLALDAHQNQTAAAIGLTDRRLVELATGEGKTLAAAIAAAYRALVAPRCHVVTANDYLAERDATDTAPLFEALHLAVRHIAGPSSEPQRRSAYTADITYATAREFAADYLRRELAARRDASHPLSSLKAIAPTLTTDPPTHPATTPPYRFPSSVLVDEADFVLIDDANTPLVLSDAPTTPADPAPYAAARHAALTLRVGEHFTIDHQRRRITLNDAGRRTLETSPTPLRQALPRDADDMLTAALAAEYLYREGTDYVLTRRSSNAQTSITIIDPATGRPSPDRAWQGGIHQAVQTKHDIATTAEPATRASISFQRYFRMPFHLAGLTGTAADAAAETAAIYSLPLVRVPTHRPVRRVHHPTRFFRTQADADAAATTLTARAIANAQPVLIASDSVERSDTIARKLRDHTVNPAVLNALHHENESHTVARAGNAGAVTVATNMAGRGTDIKPDPEALDAGGLHVITLTPGNSRRYERQMLGRAARQGQPGEHTPLASAEDPLLKRFAPGAAAILAAITPTAGLHPHLAPAANALLRHAQRRAQRQAKRARAALADHESALDHALAFAHTV